MKGDSLRRQTEASEKYATEHGLILDYSLRLKDLGISAFHGKHATEGELAAFFTAVQTGRVPTGSTLLVESLDRLSREKVTEALTQFLNIINAGITVVTLLDKMVYSKATINENPGSLMLSIVHMMRAHDESAYKSKRIGEAWANKRKVALENKTPRGKNCPNWLKLVKGEDGKKRYVVIPERAELLVRMFELAASGLGKRSIAKILNAEGNKPWRVGNEWAESSLHFLLKWPAAMGIYQPCRLDPETRRRIPEGPPIEGYFPQVISNELWQRAQCRTQAPRGPRRPSTHNLFTGLVTDAHNGYKMHYNEKTAAGITRVYLCTARLRPEGIKSQMWPYDEFERTVLEHLRDLDWSSLVNKGPDQETAKLRTQIADAELQLGKLDADINKFMDTVAEMPDILRQSAMAKAARMAKEKEELQARLDELQREMTQLQAVLGWINDWPDERVWQRSYMKPLLMGARARASELGYQMDEIWIGNIREDDPAGNFKRWERILSARGIHGVILPYMYRQQHYILPWANFSVVSLGKHHSLVEESRIHIPDNFEHHRVSSDYAFNIRRALTKLREAGRRRIGLAVGPFHDAETDHAYSAVFSWYWSKWPVKDRVPILFSDRVDAVRNWATKHRPDAVICNHSDVRTAVEQAGLSIPQQTRLVHLSVAPDVADWTGIDRRMPLLGSAAVDMVSAHLQRNERGVPPYAKEMVIEGVWVEGKT